MKKCVMFILSVAMFNFNVEAMHQASSGQASNASSVKEVFFPLDIHNKMEQYVLSRMQRAMPGEKLVKNQHLKVEVVTTRITDFNEIWEFLLPKLLLDGEPTTREQDAYQPISIPSEILSTEYHVTLIWTGQGGAQREFKVVIEHQATLTWTKQDGTKKQVIPRQLFSDICFK